MKTKIDEINRNIYDIKNQDNYDYKIKKGLTSEIIEELSNQKDDPDWMKEFRLKALDVYNKLELPTWGPNLSELDMSEIATYVRPKSKLNNSWEDVPEDIKNIADSLLNLTHKRLNPQKLCTEIINNLEKLLMENSI